MALVLGTPIDALTMDTALLRVAHMAESDQGHLVVTANPEILYRATYDHTARMHLEQASMRTADGIGVLLAAKLLGQQLPSRVTGVALAEAIVKKSAERPWRIFFLGAAPGVAEKAKENLLAKYPAANIVGTYHGYWNAIEEVLPHIKEQAPNIVFVAMGSPRQEAVALELLKAVPTLRVAMGVGGSFDVFSGNVRRAPLIYQRLGLEWLYRIVRDPKRLRRAGALPKFVWAVCKERIKNIKKEAVLK